MYCFVSLLQYTIFNTMTEVVNIDNKGVAMRVFYILAFCINVFPTNILGSKMVKRLLL